MLKLLKHSMPPRMKRTATDITSHSLCARTLFQDRFVTGSYHVHSFVPLQYLIQHFLQYAFSEAENDCFVFRVFECCSGLVKWLVVSPALIQHHIGWVWCWPLLPGPVERGSGQALQLRGAGHLDPDWRPSYRRGLRWASGWISLHLKLFLNFKK